MTFPEQVGPYTLHAPRSDDPEPAWTIALNQVAVPGCYTTRDAALIAGGIILADEQHGRLLLLAVRDAHPGRAVTVEQLADAESVLASTDVAGKIREELADMAREKARKVAARPPDPKLSPRAGVNFLVAEGWYQAADWLCPKETT